MRTLLLVCLSVVLAGCYSAGAPHAKTAERGIVADSAGGFYADGLADADLKQVVADPGDLPPMPTDPSRKVIYNADFEVRVSNLEHARERTRAIAVELGGHMQKEQNLAVTLRVPAAGFAAAVEQIGALGPIVSREVTASDVTEEFLDLEIRLKVKQDYLAQLNRLYEQGGALKDLLEIKREVDKVTEEIERLKGRLRFLGDRIAMSTITVRFQLTTTHIDRRFKLPFSWLETLGIENLLTTNRGA